MLVIAACLLDCNETTSKLVLFCCHTFLVVGNQVALREKLEDWR
jgi:hypothetical protein